MCKRASLGVWRSAVKHSHVARWGMLSAMPKKIAPSSQREAPIAKQPRAKTLSADRSADPRVDPRMPSEALPPRSRPALEVGVRRLFDQPLPTRASALAAGLDLRAALTRAIVLQPLERRLVPTGIAIELPAGHEAQVRPRSGLAVHQGITVLNAPGTIDADYRGEVQVLLVNLSPLAQRIDPGMRIAQLVVARVEDAVLVERELGATKRGGGGFGSTGAR